MYIVATIIQLFGLFAASTVSLKHSRTPIRPHLVSPVIFTLSSQRRARLMRIYAYGSILTALCIIAGGLTRIIIHFTQKVSNGFLAFVVAGILTALSFLESSFERVY